jgi:DNA-binding GntR family transcriptional regulator
MVRLATAPTVPDRVESMLRTAIVQGSLKPGAPIVESRLARELGVGQPTVREALKALESQGLVVRHQNRGCTVVQLSAEDVAKIFRLRVEWETLAAELAMESWTEGKAQTLKAAAQAMADAAHTGDLQTFYACDLAFHEALWRAADNAFLSRALRDVTVPLFAFAIIRRVNDRGLDLKKSAASHLRLVRALRSGRKREALPVVRAILQGFEEEGVVLFADGEPAS